TGQVSLRAAWALTLAAAGVFVGAAALLGPLCLALSPVALALLFGYSYTKRFTFLCHLFLGLAIAAGPAGAWIAVRGDFGWPPRPAADRASLLVRRLGPPLPLPRPRLRPPNRPPLHPRPLRHHRRPDPLRRPARHHRRRPDRAGPRRPPGHSLSVRRGHHGGP